MKRLPSLYDVPLTMVIWGAAMRLLRPGESAEWDDEADCPGLDWTDDECHDVELLFTVPSDLDLFTQEERAEWGESVRSRAKSECLRSADPRVITDTLLGLDLPSSFVEDTDPPGGESPNYRHGWPARGG